MRMFHLGDNVAGKVQLAGKFPGSAFATTHRVSSTWKRLL